MEDTNAGSDTLNRRVAEAVASGKKPIELLFEPIYDCGGDDEVVAYRAGAVVNSLLIGTLTPADYLRAAVPEKLLFDLTFRLLGKTASAATELAALPDRPKLLTLRVPTSLIYTEEDLTSALLGACAGAADSVPLCLEFYEDAMDADGATLSRAIAAIHAAGLHVAVDGYGGEDFPMEKLLSVCPDFLFTSPRVAALSTDRGRAAALAPLLNFAKSLGAEIIADAVADDTALREFRARDAFGFLPAQNYTGAACRPIEALTIEKIKGKQNEENKTL